MADSYHFTPHKRPRTYGRWEGKKYIPDDMTPAVVRCANCGNYVRYIIQVVSVFKLREGHPQIAASGKDKIFRTENWCMKCIQSGGIEDDAGRVMLGVGYGSG